MLRKVWKKVVVKTTGGHSHKSDNSRENQMNPLVHLGLVQDGGTNKGRPVERKYGGAQPPNDGVLEMRKEVN